MICESTRVSMTATWGTEAQGILATSRLSNINLKMFRQIKISSVLKDLFKYAIKGFMLGPIEHGKTIYTPFNFCDVLLSGKALEGTIESSIRFKDCKRNCSLGKLPSIKSSKLPKMIILYQSQTQPSPLTRHSQALRSLLRKIKSTNFSFLWRLRKNFSYKMENKIFTFCPLFIVKNLQKENIEENVNWNCHQRANRSSPLFAFLLVSEES